MRLRTREQAPSFSMPLRALLLEAGNGAAGAHGPRAGASAIVGSPITPSRLSTGIWLCDRDELAYVALFYDLQQVAPASGGEVEAYV